MKLKKDEKLSLSEDLSHIDNIEDLESEIRRVKAAIQVDENILKAQLKSVPVEGIRTVFGNPMPFFAKTTVAERTWNIFKTVVALFLHKPGGQSGMKGIFTKENRQETIKQIGIFAGIELIKAILAKTKNKD